MVRGFSSTILLVALMFTCIALPSEGNDRDYYPPDSALSISELRCVLEITEMVVAKLERTINALNNDPVTKNHLLRKQAMYYADATKVLAEIWRRTS